MVFNRGVMPISIKFLVKKCLFVVAIWYDGKVLAKLIVSDTAWNAL